MNDFRFLALFGIPVVIDSLIGPEKPRLFGSPLFDRPTILARDEEAVRRMVAEMNGDGARSDG